MSDFGTEYDSSPYRGWREDTDAGHDRADRTPDYDRDPETGLPYDETDPLVSGDYSGVYAQTAADEPDPLRPTGEASTDDVDDNEYHRVGQTDVELDLATPFKVDATAESPNGRGGDSSSELAAETGTPAAEAEDNAGSSYDDIDDNEDHARDSQRPPEDGDESYEAWRVRPRVYRSSFAEWSRGNDEDELTPLETAIARFATGVAKVISESRLTEDEKKEVRRILSAVEQAALLSPAELRAPEPITTTDLPSERKQEKAETGQEGDPVASTPDTPISEEIEVTATTAEPDGEMVETTMESGGEEADTSQGVEGGDDIRVYTELADVVEGSEPLGQPHVIPAPSSAPLAHDIPTLASALPDPAGEQGPATILDGDGYPAADPIVESSTGHAAALGDRVTAPPIPVEGELLDATGRPVRDAPLNPAEQAQQDATDVLQDRLREAAEAAVADAVGAAAARIVGGRSDRAGVSPEVHDETVSDGEAGAGSAATAMAGASTTDPAPAGATATSTGPNADPQTAASAAPSSGEGPAGAASASPTTDPAPAAAPANTDPAATNDPSAQTPAATPADPTAATTAAASAGPTAPTAPTSSGPSATGPRARGPEYRSGRPGSRSRQQPGRHRAQGRRSRSQRAREESRARRALHTMGYMKDRYVNARTSAAVGRVLGTLVAAVGTEAGTAAVTSVGAIGERIRASGQEVPSRSLLARVLKNYGILRRKYDVKVANDSGRGGHITVRVRARDAAQGRAEAERRPAQVRHFLTRRRAARQVM